ncbi:MAG: lysophospholipid transporter LplT [Rhodocyclales bacterium]|nr:lysophospholipid transporter LplT [Rhodocyclales bacterium]
MPRGFYFIMAAQFFSALADNALLIVAMGILRQLEAPPEYEPLLKLFFTLSYVLLAAFVGAFADSMPKWRVMLVTNTIKIAGCLLIVFGVHPLLGYAIVGVGAAAYSPAKYGILTEYLPHRLLVVANGWIEGLTVAAIILGTLLGGVLVAPSLVAQFDAWFPWLHNGLWGSLLVVVLVYGAASVCNLYVPDTGVAHVPLKKNPFYLLHEFGHYFLLLWRDKLGQISLAVTTLFWGAGATLQFIVLKWAEVNLGLPLSHASMLQGVVAVGIAAGSVAAAKWVALREAPRVIPLGIVMGLVVISMIFVHSLVLAMVLMIAVGALAGFFVVPMNAMLQHRGHVLMGAGHSIAVQNFNENLAVLAMTGLYALLLRYDWPVHQVIVLFGLFVAGTMVAIWAWHRANQRRIDSLHLLEMVDHH